MTSESPLNIFSSTAKKTKPPSQGGGAIEQSKQKKPIAIRNFAVEAMLERMHQMQQEIDDKIDEVSHKHGITKEQLMEYLSNPKNFSPEQWKFITNRNMAFKNKLYASLGINSNDNSSPAVASAPANPGKRKGKLLGARRNWLSTH